ncbi:Alpha/Beta hydrolase protein [Neurospora crassa]|nr:Alpha/Beta hydrolase protein [Neurospora crassa]
MFPSTTYLFISLGFFSLSSALIDSASIGVKFASPSALPVLTLPYGSYQASSYRSKSDIYVFRNIRYAAPPVGDLRWAKPAAPQINNTIQDGSYGPQCIQTAVSGLNLMGPGNKSPIGAALNQFLGGLPIPLFSGGSEDCLFLDLYIPGKTLRDLSGASKKPSPLPVAFWIHGGAYLFGSKESLQPFFYDGSSLLTQSVPSPGSMIFVSINYRLGTYGWLAGTSMENSAVPNAGLHDQRAALQWVKDYISLVGGDPKRVTAMGESAGAGSIMHHLMAEGGKLDPMFQRAILQSPAYQMAWDRNGTVDAIFNKFGGLAGCSSSSGKAVVNCLRKTSPDALAKANAALQDSQMPGTFAVGPTPDGRFIRQMPLLELAQGNFWKGQSGSEMSLLISHVKDESSLFVSGAIRTNEQFSGFLDTVFPNYARESGHAEKVEQFYPVPGKKSADGKRKYDSQATRMAAFLRDSCFTCNVRYLAEAYTPSRTYLMQYSVFPYLHATDLLPTFFTSTPASSSSSSPQTILDCLSTFFAPALAPFVSGISMAMQSYFASFIVSGDPNTYRKGLLNLPPVISWGKPSGIATAGSKAASSEERMGGVLNVGDWGFTTVRDDQNERTPCEFWKGFAREVSEVGGYEL